MNTTLLAFLGWPEIVAILVIVLVLFGAKKVPELMRGMGQGLKEFKKATREVQDEVQRAMEEPPEAPATPAPRKPASAPESSEAAVPKA